jgi:ankyrin repeat protein
MHRRIPSLVKEMVQPPPTGGLGDLPPEIMHLIAQQITSDRVLNALVQTTRYFHEILNPYLYAYNASRKGRSSALIWAAKEGREETMRLALRYHNPLKKTKPLIVAVQHNRSRIVEMLLATDGVDIEALDSKKSTPLEIAVKNDCESIVKQLLDAGANAHPRKTTMEMRYKGYDSLLLKSIRLGHQGVARHLIRCRKYNLDAINRSNHTALIVAIQMQRDQVIQDLLVAGADPNTAGPLYMAVWKKNAPAVRLLLDYGAEPNGVQGSRGGTLIHDVMNYGALEVSQALQILQALLDCENLDVNRANSVNEMPLEYALARGKLEALKLLLRREDVDVNRGLPFRRAVRKGYAEIVQAFLDTNRLSPVSINEGLLAAIDEGNLEMMLLLLSREEIDVNYELPLRRAIQHGHVNIAQALLADGRLNQESKFEGLTAVISRNEESTNVLFRPILDSGVVLEGENGKYTLQALLKEAYFAENFKAVAALISRGVAGRPS